jgi:hypothetical protein
VQKYKKYSYAWNIGFKNFHPNITLYRDSPINISPAKTRENKKE